MSLTFLTLIAGLVLASGAVYVFVSVILKQNSEAEALSWMDGKEPEKSKFPLINFRIKSTKNYNTAQLLAFSCLDLIAPQKRSVF